MISKTFIFKKNKDITLEVEGNLLTNNKCYCPIYMSKHSILCIFYSASYIFGPIFTIGHRRIYPCTLCVDMLKDEIEK